MRELMSYLPKNYLASQESITFQAALQSEVNLIWEARDSLLAQLDPYTADWGLDYWEDALGLANGLGLDLDLRRRQIAAKLQGRATTTPEVVKTVAETLLGVDVTVVEIFDQYLVQLETTAGYRPGGAAARLRERMRDIMPAHLDWQLVIPAVIHIPIRAALGPRISRAAPPPYRAALPLRQIHAAARLGVRRSTIALPMAAEYEGGTN